MKSERRDGDPARAEACRGAFSAAESETLWAHVEVTAQRATRPFMQEPKQ